MNRSHGSYVSDFAVLVVWTFDPTLLLVHRLMNADMVVRGDDCLGLQRLCRHTSYQHDCSNISAVIKRWRRGAGSDFALWPLGRVVTRYFIKPSPSAWPGIVACGAERFGENTYDVPTTPPQISKWPLNLHQPMHLV